MRNISALYYNLSFAKIKDSNPIRMEFEQENWLQCKIMKVNSLRKARITTQQHPKLLEHVNSKYLKEFENNPFKR